MARREAAILHAVTEEWLERHRRELGLASAGLFVFALGVGLWAHEVGMLPGERWVVDRLFMTSGGSEAVSESTGFFVGTGAPPVVALLVGTATWLTWRRLRSWAWVVPLTLVAPLLASLGKGVGTVTIAMAEARGAPLGFLPSTLPSAHSAYAASFFSMLVVLALLVQRRDLAAFAGIIGVGVGVSTIVNGSHAPSDVVCGYALGLGWTALLIVVRSVAPRQRR